jgi:hypothetical protein
MSITFSYSVGSPLTTVVVNTVLCVLAITYFPLGHSIINGDRNDVASFIVIPI